MNTLEEAIHNRLSASADIVAAVGTRIFRGVAPLAATFPVIIYAKAGGGHISETPETSINVIYLIQAVSSESANEAEEIAAYLETAMHKAALADTITDEEGEDLLTEDGDLLLNENVADWINYWTAVEDHLQAVPLSRESGQVVYHAGRYVRVRLGTI